jgi:hypothetical protein
MEPEELIRQVIFQLRRDAAYDQTGEAGGSQPVPCITPGPARLIF